MLNVREMNVALAHHHNLLARPGDAALIERCKVVDGCQVPGEQEMDPAQGRVVANMRRTPGSWLGAKIVQPSDQRNHRIERAGNRGVDRVGTMEFSLDVVAVDFGVEGMLHAGRVPAKE